MRARAVSLAFVGVLATAGIGTAGSLTGGLNVTAAVPAGCTELSTTPVAFGNFTGADVDADGSITINCTEGARFGIKLGQGMNFNRHVTLKREMVGPTGTSLTFPLGFHLPYELYQDPSRMVLWGDCLFSPFCANLQPLTAGLTGGLQGFGTGSPQTLPVYGRLFGGKFIPGEGNYGDAVGVSLDF